MTYPHTRRDDTVDNLHGTAVPDPYRWLEDADNPEVQEWVAAQRDFTEAQLQHLPARGWFTELMGRIVARPRAGVPLKRGGRWFVSRNDGTSAQDLELATLGWVHWQNTKRLHGYLGDIPPAEFEQAFYAGQTDRTQLVGIK